MDIEISLIWAMAENRVIGRNNSLPWRLPNDMRHFMQTTLGKPVVMGRKTFESMKAPLPGRTNIVLTRDPAWSHPGVRVVADIQQAIEAASQQALIDGVDELMVIGGAEIYALALPLAHRLYITWVHDRPQGDCYFPAFDMAAWHELERKDYPADDRHSSAFSIASYRRL